MSKLPDNFDRLLDGLLTGPEKDQAERAVQAEPEAREQAELQRRIDDAIGRLFAPPAAARPARRIPAWPWAAAAAVLLTMAGVYWFVLRPPADPLGPVWVTPQAYRAAVAD